MKPSPAPQTIPELNDSPVSTNTLMTPSAVRIWKSYKRTWPNVATALKNMILSALSGKRYAEPAQRQLPPALPRKFELA